MSKLSDFLISAILPTIESVGQSKLEELLQKFHDTDEEKYKATIVAGAAFIKPLIEYVGKTSTTIDDGIVDAINEAIKASAQKNGVAI